MADLDDRKRQANQALKYSGIAFQMAITIGLFVYGGIRLDEYLENDTKVWTLVGSLLGTVLAVVNVIRQVLHP